jgi:hypothetical protein
LKVYILLSLPVYLRAAVNIFQIQHEILRRNAGRKKRFWCILYLVFIFLNKKGVKYGKDWAILTITILKKVRPVASRNF